MDPMVARILVLAFSVRSPGFYPAATVFITALTSDVSESFATLAAASLRHCIK
jgi:hypothetical protein